MRAVKRCLRRSTVSFSMAILLAGRALAQQEVGALYGIATDTEGTPLPGVQVSDERGQFRFLGLDPGNWALEAKLDGFSMVEYPAIDIRVIEAAARTLGTASV